MGNKLQTFFLNEQNMQQSRQKLIEHVDRKNGSANVRAN